MANEEESRKPVDRPAAPAKPAAGAFVSTFINKDTSGKKFVPKAGVRRRARPAAAAPPATAAASQTAATTPAPSTPPVEPQAALPTPDATQETVVQEISHAAEKAATNTETPNATVAPAPVTQLASPPPTQTGPENVTPADPKRTEEVAAAEKLPAVIPARQKSPRPAEEELASGRSPKRPRIGDVTVLEQPSAAPAAPIISSTEPALDRHVDSGVQPDKDPRAQETGTVQDPTVSLVPVAPMFTPTPAPSAVPAAFPNGRPDTLTSPAPLAERQEKDAAQITIPALAPTSVEPAAAPSSNNQDVGSSATVESQVPAPAEQSGPRRTRRLPWQAINRPHGDENGPTATSGPVRSSARAREKRKATTTQAENEDDGHAEEEEMAVRTVRRVTDKGKEPVRDKPSHEWTPEEPPKKPRKPRKDIGQKRKKRNTQAQQDEQEEQDGAVGEGAPGPATDNASNEWRPEPPPKKARKPRKDKGQKRKKPDSEEQQGEEGIEGEAGPAERGTQAKRRRVTKKGTEPLANGAEAEQEEGEGGDQDRPARRRGRERATTPEDAETHVLDPKETTMDQLASRNFRTGRISKREQQMREINWEEVEQRRREANKRKENVLLTRAEVQAQLAEAAEARAQAQEQRQQRRTRTELVNGQIVLVEEQADDDDIIDGDAEDAANIVEEGDLTVRITTKSFMRANKKFPDELMLPGQAPRWTNELTDRFYDGLRMFGTDFSMISTLFEHSTRRSMKLKFNREEREHPERVKEALNKQRDSNWEEYITKRGIKGDPKDYFADVEEIKRDLEAQKEAMQVEIDAAKAAAEEERRQRRIAGVLSEDENADPKEDGRKKRKKKNKGVSWMEEEGVEILGEGEGEDDW